MDRRLSGGVGLRSSSAVWVSLSIVAWAAGLSMGAETIGGAIYTDLTNPLTTGLQGVTVAGTGGTTGTFTATTGAGQGLWQIANVPDGTDTVTPSLTGKGFLHVAQGAANVQTSITITVDQAHRAANQSIQFLAGDPIADETLGGAVCTDLTYPATNGLAGATITVAGTGGTSGTYTAPTAGAAGLWQIDNVPVGTYTVTPSKSGYLFQHVAGGVADGQASLTITVNQANRAANQDIRFVAYVVGAAIKLGFVVAPGASYYVNAQISPALQVAVQDASGQTATSSTATIALALGQHPAGGTLSGTLTQQAANGVATFVGLSINKVGTGYTLAASSPGLTGVASNAFAVTTGAPTRLGFATQPGDAGKDGTLSTAPVVGIYDSFDNLVANSNLLVTVALATGPHATLSGTKTVVAGASGLATFNGLSVNQAGTYTLSATSMGLISATSGTFVKGGTPQLTIAKTDSADPVDPDTDVTYTITYGNTGGAATKVVITETLPSQLTFVSATGGGNYTAADRKIRWPIQSLAASTVDQQVTFVAKVDAKAVPALKDGGVITNNSLTISCDGVSAVTAAPETTTVNDKQGPTTTPVLPLAHAEHVPPRPLVTLTVTDPSGVDFTAVKISIAGVLIYDGGKETALGAYDSSSIADAQVKGTCRRTPTGPSTTYTFTFVPSPSMAFGYEKKVDVVVEATDKVGNAAPAYTYSFTTLLRTFGKNSRVNSDAGSLIHDNPATAADTTGNLWVVWDQADTTGKTDIYAGLLPYGGSAFQASRLVAAGASKASNPAIAVNAAGVAYVAWQANSDSGHWAIYVSSSSNQGTTWSNQVKVSATDPVNPSDKTAPAIAIAGPPSNTISVVWEDNSGGHSNVWLGASTDTGATWTQTQLSKDTSNAMSPGIMIDAANVVYVGWTDSRNTATTGTDIYGASSDHGPWTNVALVHAAGDQSSTAGAAGASTVHFAWVSGTGDTGDILYENDTGTFPLTGTSITDGSMHTVQRMPALAVRSGAGTETVYACWEDGRNVVSGNKDSDIYFAESSSPFGTNILVNDDKGKSTQTKPAIGVDKTGNPYLVWVDNRGGSYDIDYAGTTAIGAPMARTVTTDAGGTTTVQATAKPNLEVKIPKDALPAGVDVQDVSVAPVTSLPELPAQGGFGLCYNFEPSGTQFSSPATLRVPLEVGAPVRNPYKVFRYDPGDLTSPYYPWTENGIHNPATLGSGGAYLEVQVDHFSIFATGGVVVNNDGGGGEGGGGGGCALAPWSNGNPVAYSLPFVVYVLVLLGITYVDSPRRKAGANRRQ